MQERSDDPPVRLGVVRPDRPRAVVAAAEARVVRCELERRLGPIGLDLRIEGDAVAPWQPWAHAAWPADVDAVIDASLLWRPALPPLTALFGRTVEPAAAEVRRRMLHHLGMLPVDHVGAETLDELEELSLRPTDLWLIVGGATSVATGDPAVDALTATPDGDAAATLDEAFDDVVDALRAESPVRALAGSALQRALTEIISLRRRISDDAADFARSEREYLQRIDELASEHALLRERIERLELGGRLGESDASP